MADKGWSRAFDDPIELASGRALRTLRDAGEYVTALPKAEHNKPHWLTAAHELMMTAERGLTAMRPRHQGASSAMIVCRGRSTACTSPP